MKFKFFCFCCFVANFFSGCGTGSSNLDTPNDPSLIKEDPQEPIVVPEEPRYSDPKIVIDTEITNGDIRIISNSYDPDGGEIRSYFWTIQKDGNRIYSSKDKEFTLLNLKKGVYDIFLMVKDNESSYTMEWHSFEILNENDTPSNFVIDYSPNYSLGRPSNKNPYPIDYEYKRGGFLEQTNAFEAYTQGWTGNGVKVAILDTGIDKDHIDLNDNIYGVYDTTSGGTSGEDDNGHGTHVAGIIAAENNNIGMMGVAYEADVISIKVLSASGSGSWTDIREGLDLATDLNSKVTNLSLSSTWWNPSYRFNEIASIRNALENDNSLIVAAGNNSTNCNFGSDNVVSGCNYPAALPGYYEYSDLINGTYDGAFVTVGSVNSDNELAYYSNEAGITKDWYIVAPGGDFGNSDYIYSTYLNGTYTEMQGTSMATPVVTGAFALMAQKYPYLTGAQIRDIYFATTTDLGEEGVDEVYGHGLINIEKAMQPIGDISIPVDGYVFNTSSQFDITQTKISSSNILGDSLLNNLNFNSVGVDSFNRGFSFDLSSNISNNNYTFDFNNIDCISFNEFFSLGVEKYNKNLVTSFNLFDKLKLKSSVSNDFLGSIGSGAFEFKDSMTFYNEISTNFGNLFLNGFFGYAKSKGNGVISNITNTYAYGGSVEYLVDNFKFGFKLPLRTYNGDLVLNNPVSVNIDGSVNYNVETIDLKPNGFHKDFLIEWNKKDVFDFFDFKITNIFSKDFGNIKNNDVFNLNFVFSKKF